MALSPEQHQELVKTLHARLTETQVPDTVVLQRATAALKDLYRNAATIPALFEVMTTAPEKSIRQAAAVALRKQVNTKLMWPSTPVVARSHIKGSLFNAVRSETEYLVRNSVAQVISAIAGLEFREHTWPELLPFVEKSCTSAVAVDREVGSYILFSILEVVVEGMTSQVSAFLRLFTTLIADPESVEVRITTVRSLGVLAAYIDLDDKADIRAFQALVPQLLAVVGETVSRENSDGAHQVFDALQTLFILEVPLLSKQVPALVELLIQIGRNKDVDEEYRLHALNSLVMTVKYKKSKIQSLGLAKPLIETVLPILTEEEPVDEDEENPQRIAVRVLDTLATNLPPTQIFPPLSELVQQYFSSPDAANRRGALHALGIVVEGCSEFMKPHMDRVWPFIDNGLKDPDASVRKAACNALGCVAEWLEDACSERHAILIPALLNLIHDPVTQGPACLALDSILELMHGSIAPYIGPLMETLTSILDTAPSKTKINVIGAISSAAHAAKREFAPFFPTTIARLVPFLQLEGQGDEEELRGVAMDAVGSFAEAVGSEAFQPYFSDLMTNAYSCLKSESSRLRECAFLYFGQMAKLFTEAFAPYLPNIIPVYLTSIKQDEIGDENIINLTQMINSASGLSSDTAIEIPEERLMDLEDIDPEKALKVNSGIAIEKEIALDTIGDIFAATKGHFLPYLEASIDAVSVGLSHYFEGIRKASITTLFQFIVTFHELSEPVPWEAGLAQDNVKLHDNVNKLLLRIMPDLIEIFEVEDEKDVVGTLFAELADATTRLGPGLILPYLEAISDQILKVLDGKSLCQLDPDEEEEEADGQQGELSEFDSVLLGNAMDLVSALASVLGTDFGAAFGTYLPLITKYYSPQHSPGDRAQVIGCLSEICSSLKEGVTQYTETLFALFMGALEDEESEVRSNAAFAIGVLVENSSQDTGSQFMNILAKLQPFFQPGESPSQADLHGRDNAAGAVGRLITTNAGALPLDSVLPVLFSALPLQVDPLENGPVYRAIFHIFETNADYAIATYFDGLVPAIATVLDTANPKKQLTDDTRNSLFALLKAVEAKAPGKVSSTPLAQFLTA